MGFQWSNEQRLITLSAVGEENILTFEAADDVAEVILDDDGEIAQVNVSSKRKGTSIQADVKKPRQTLYRGGVNTYREVRHWLVPGEVALEMRLGQTIHSGKGSWSSTPHEFENYPEDDFEEVFFYQLEGGSAIHIGRGKWADGTEVDTMWKAKDKTFGCVPMGYHPIVGEPGVRVRYIWCYLAKKDTWEKV